MGREQFGQKAVPGTTASTIDSYKSMLAKTILIALPDRVFEWGPGNSTNQIERFPSVLSVDSVEHDEHYYSLAIKSRAGTSKVHYRPNVLDYREEQGRYKKYGLVFVDGIDREICLMRAQQILNEDGIVVLHDAERGHYENPIASYDYVFWGDEGHTAVLTNSKEMSSRLRKFL